MDLFGRRGYVGVGIPKQSHQALYSSEIWKLHICSLAQLKLSGFGNFGDSHSWRRKTDYTRIFKKLLVS